MYVYICLYLFMHYMYTYMLYDASGAPAATVELCSNRDACLYEYIHTYIHPYIHTYIHPSIHTYMHKDGLWNL